MLACMARAPRKDRRSDPRIHDLGRTVESLRATRGVSKRQLALRSGVDQSHLGKFIAGSAGLGLDDLMNVLQVLGAGLAVEQGAEAATTQLVGTLSAKGEVAFFGGAAMPGAIRIDNDFGPFKALDTIVFAAGGWEDGRYVLVEHADGTWRVHRCEARHGLQFLVSAEAILYVPESHKIIGQAVERRERL